MQRLEVSGAVRLIYASLGFKGLIPYDIMVQNLVLPSSIHLYTTDTNCLSSICPATRSNVRAAKGY